MKSRLTNQSRKAYPEIVATEFVIQEDLPSTGSRISFARKHYDVGLIRISQEASSVGHDSKRHHCEAICDRSLWPSSVHFLQMSTQASCVAAKLGSSRVPAH